MKNPKMEDYSEWVRKAYNYTFLAKEPFIIVGCLKTVGCYEIIESVESPSSWGVGQYSSRQELDLDYQDFLERKRHHFIAAFDKTSPEWEENRPVYFARTS